MLQSREQVEGCHALSTPSTTFILPVEPVGSHILLSATYLRSRMRFPAASQPASITSRTCSGEGPRSLCQLPELYSA